MNKILEKRQLSENVYYMKFDAPDIARNRKAGQFLIVQVDQDLTERIPLTIADANADEGWVAIAFQPVGASTYKLSKLNAGDFLGGVLGPLGTPSNIRKYDAPVVCVGGGFGTAPLYPIVQALKEAGNKVILIEGARNKDLLIFVDEMKAVCDEVILMTDDGSAGEKGFVTNHSVLSEGHFTQISTCGPKPMMVAVARYAEKADIPCEVSLENKMACGLGACLCCVEKTNDKGNICICTEGPVINAKRIWQD